MYLLSTNNFFKLLDSLKLDYQVFVPIMINNRQSYQQYSQPHENINVAGVRAVEPLKAFFLSSREQVSKNFTDPVCDKTKKPVCVVGAKACDLKSFKVQDFVFKNKDFNDQFYIKNREDNLIISCDCSFAIDTCFCLSLGLKPYPQEDFDLNLSLVSSGFLVESGSKKGQEIIDKNRGLFTEPNAELEDQKKKSRQKVIDQVEKNIVDHKIPAQANLTNAVEKNFNSQIWQDEAKTCVECGACNTVCPTCHCFLLYDQSKKDEFSRMKTWDSCLLKDFARVAGGANPRPKLWMRLRNRFEKKFDFFPKVAQVYACTGCGRCISACPAKIDIRRVLKKLVSYE